MKIQEFLASGMIDDLHLLKVKPPLWEFNDRVAQPSGSPSMLKEHREGAGMMKVEEEKETRQFQNLGSGLILEPMKNPE